MMRNCFLLIWEASIKDVPIKALMARLALASVVALLSAEALRAEMNIDIRQGFFEPLPVAVTDLYGTEPEEISTGLDISRVIAANLERSGLFRPIDPGAFIQDGESLNNGPRFGDWRLINAQALISGAVKVQNDGRLKVEFRLWDVYAENQMTGLAYFTTPENWRRVAHIISDVSPKAPRRCFILGLRVCLI